jgi:hypothetical protein
LAGRVCRRARPHDEYEIFGEDQTYPTEIYYDSTDTRYIFAWHEKHIIVIVMRIAKNEHQNSTTATDKRRTTQRCNSTALWLLQVTVLHSFSIDSEAPTVRWSGVVDSKPASS